MKYPQELRYTKDHEWVRIDGKRARIGVTAFAVDQLGDITLIDLPKVGSKLQAGASCGTIESVKSVSDLFAPVSGTVAAINTQLEQHPEWVNESPYDTGWMLDVEIEGAMPNDLLDAAGYQALLAEA